MKFYKYQGTGNDFVMIDNRTKFFPKKDTKRIAKLCNRHFGIGADGLIFLEDDLETDFRMIYYNSDGNQSSMCGNGGRCIVAFAKHLGIIHDKTSFIATDGLHFASIENNTISLQMQDVKTINATNQYVFLDTGSPHHVVFVEDLENFDVKKEGAKIRYGNLYGKSGSNVNFVKQSQDNIFSVRTYERGVEDETLSCGTGAVAVALAMHQLKKTISNNIQIQTKGGSLEISFNWNEKKCYTNIFLTGTAELVFEGHYYS